MLHYKVIQSSITRTNPLWRQYRESSKLVPVWQILRQNTFCSSSGVCVPNNSSTISSSVSGGKTSSNPASPPTDRDNSNHSMKNSIRVTVNDIPVNVPLGSTYLDATKAAGVSVPTLCYHPRYKAKALCRLCLVDVAGSWKPLPACSTPAKDGDSITTDSTSLNEYRKMDTQMLMSRHPNECMRCEVSGSCKLQNIVQSNELQELWPAKMPRGDQRHHPEHALHDHTSPAIYRDMDKCIECGLCVQACGGGDPADKAAPLHNTGQNQNIIGFAERGGGTLPVTVWDKPLGETDCISCGQCTVVCPVGALIERPDWHRVKDVLDSKRRRTVVQVAPATRVAIGEEFGMDPGTVNTGRLVNALRALGFDYVFDTNFSADLTIMEEASELLMRVGLHKKAASISGDSTASTGSGHSRSGGHNFSNFSNFSSSSSSSSSKEAADSIAAEDAVLAAAANKPLPQFTSCCPGWVNWLEIHRPDLLRHLSTTKSPQQMLGSLAKRGVFPHSAELNIPRRGNTLAHTVEVNLAVEQGNGKEGGETKTSVVLSSKAGEHTAGSGSDTQQGPFSSGQEEVYVVSVMPCTAKKDEAVRPGHGGDIDAVITTRELARLIRAKKIPFASLSNEGDFDNPLGEGSGAAVIFGASGGVMEAALRTAAHVLAVKSAKEREELLWSLSETRQIQLQDAVDLFDPHHNSNIDNIEEAHKVRGSKDAEVAGDVSKKVSAAVPTLEFHSLRGELAGVKVATIPGVGEVAVCNGIASAQRLFGKKKSKVNHSKKTSGGLLENTGKEEEEDDSNAPWRKYVAIEVMTCVGGCLGGGGEPKSDDPLVLLKRKESIYNIDKGQKKRNSHENGQVQRLYDTFLGEPLGEESERLLHTTFSARHSDRELLARFLDAVDRRDGGAAAKLFFSSDSETKQQQQGGGGGVATAVWHTNTECFGDIEGQDGIAQFINEKLPRNKKGPQMQRHRFVDPVVGTTVLAPTGETVRFDITTVGHGSQKRILTLSRVPVPAADMHRHDGGGKRGDKGGTEGSTAERHDMDNNNNNNSQEKTSFI